MKLKSTTQMTKTEWRDYRSMLNKLRVAANRIMAKNFPIKQVRMHPLDAQLFCHVEKTCHAAGCWGFHSVVGYARIVNDRTLAKGTAVVVPDMPNIAWLDPKTKKTMTFGKTTNLKDSVEYSKLKPTAITVTFKSLR